MSPVAASDLAVPTSTASATNASSSDGNDPSTSSQAAAGPGSADPTSAARSPQQLPRDEAATDSTSVVESVSATSVALTGTNTTSTSTSAATSTLYIFASKYNTSQTTFNDYVKELDDTAGTLISYPGNPTQAYQTNLSDSQVSDVKAQPWLNWITPVPPSEDDEGYEDNRAVRPDTREDSLSVSDEISLARVTAVPDPHKRAPELVKRAITTRNPTLASQLKLISAPYPVPNGTQPDFSQNYRFDDSLGAGSTIYIVDTGFNLDAADLAATGRTVNTFVVPNSLTLPNNYQGPVVLPGAYTETALPEDITDRSNDPISSNGSVATGRGHGTGVASAAAGLTYGVASRANLYLIKGKNGVTRSYNDGSGRPDRVVLKEYQLGAITSALNEISYRVVESGNFAKAVVNLSWGLAMSPNKPVTFGSPLYREFQNFLHFAKSNGIAVVCAAGNTGGPTARTYCIKHLSSATNADR